MRSAFIPCRLGKLGMIGHGPRYPPETSREVTFSAIVLYCLNCQMLKDIVKVDILGH